MGGGGVYYTELHYFTLHFWLFFVYGVIQCSQTRYTKIVREDMSGILILWDFHIRSSLTSGIASLKVELKYFHRCQFLFSP